MKIDKNDLKNFIVSAVPVIGAVFVTANTALAYSIKSVGFTAPEIRDPATNSPGAEQGAIVFDSSVGSNGNFLGFDGATWLTLSASAPIKAAPTVQTFTASGPSSPYNKDYTFVISSGSAAVGATYINNSITYTVYATVSGATQIVMSGVGAPLSFGTLTKNSGTGDPSLAFSRVLTPLYIRVRMVGGGGGAPGSGSGGANGTAGGDTSFGTSYLVAHGGGATGNGVRGGAGGTVSSLSTFGLAGLAVSGGDGQGFSSTALAVYLNGGMGGGTALGSGGCGAQGGTSAGGAGVAYTGAGGGGAGGNAASGQNPSPGGGGGGYIDTIITNPLPYYAFVVGDFGNHGMHGTGGADGGDGGSGIIIVEEFYQ